MIGRILLSVLIATLAVACGPDENNNRNDRNIIPGNNTNNTNNTTNNANNTTNNTNGGTTGGDWAECADLECPSDRRCVRGVCVPNDSSVGCESPESVGELTAGMTYAGTGDNTGYVDGYSTLCATELDGIYSGAEYVMSFTVPSAGSIRFDIVGTDSPFEWVAEMRQDCTDPGDQLAMNNMPPMGGDRPSECSTGPVLSFPAEPDVEYFILVEPNNSIDFGTFDWEMEFTADANACEPGRMCSGDNVIACDGEIEETFACGTGCAENACTGDTCDTAIEVTASMSFSGNIGAFTNTLDFANTAGCNEDPMEPGGMDSPGEEIVFRLPGLTAGQTVVIDTSMGSNAHTVFVLDSCSESATCVVVDRNEMFQWNVAANGDYFVVIDKSRDGQAEPFNVAFDIQ